MIGVFGGSGFYDFLDEPREVMVETPYGAPAAPYLVAEIDGAEVAILPRHGRDHQYPAHQVPFRANVFGMRELGVTHVIGPCAAGSLQMELEPGSFVVCDQLVDWTKGRAGTFHDGPELVHLSFADPYDPEMRAIALDALRNTGAAVHDGGTVVVIEGPRFSTRAESAFFAAQGWGVINMTQVPEAQLCAELGMGYVNVSVITDYDVGVEGSIDPVTHEEVLRQFSASLGTLREAIWAMVPRMATLPPASS